MADPIRLPNNTPKDISTAKITGTARQKFEKRHKGRQQKPEMRGKSGEKEEHSSGHLHDPEPFTRAVNDSQSPPRDRSAVSLDRAQGHVIDVRI